MQSGGLGQNRSVSRKKWRIKYDFQLLCLLFRFLILPHETCIYFRRMVNWIIPNPVFNGFCSDKKTQEFLSGTKILPENKLKEFWPFSYNILTAWNTNFTNTEKGHKEPFQLRLFWKETCFKVKFNHRSQNQKDGKGLAQATPGFCSSPLMKFGANCESPQHSQHPSLFICQGRFEMQLQSWDVIDSIFSPNANGFVKPELQDFDILLRFFTSYSRGCARD